MTWLMVKMTMLGMMCEDEGGGRFAAAAGDGDCVHFLGLLSQSPTHRWLKQQKFIVSQPVEASAQGVGKAGPF